MKRLLKKLNNQGSTLLTVIICIAFIGILGSMMLSVTMTNLQMKVLESKSKENFYSCEKAMEEIRVGVQEITADTIKEFYENDVLENYAYYLNLPTENDRNVDMQNKVAIALLRKLGGYASDNPIIITTDTNITPIDNILDDYTTLTLASATLTVSMPQLSSKGASIVDSAVIDADVTIQGIKIEYVADEYRSSISTDIKINIPKFTFVEGAQIEHYSMEQPFKKYVLVADGGITWNNLSGTNMVQGSVYSGVGISLGSLSVGNLTIKAENIVTRGDIKVTDKAQLKIEKQTGSLVEPIIWANNLITDTTNLDSTNAPTMDINAICVIKDDLDLEGNKSNVMLTGAYAGYTGTHTAAGSAMMINGTGATLNLSALSSLILAGRANVSVKDAIINKDADIMTGESIAFKSNQRAYLLPGDFIANILHNPVTGADITTEPTIVIPPNDPLAVINYPSYLATSPFKIAAKQTGGTILRYYYFNFLNGKLADKYLFDYITKNPDALTTMAPFSLDSVTLPPDSNMNCVGNIMYYTNESPTIKKVFLKKGLSLNPTYVSDSNDSNLDAGIKALQLSDNIYNGTGLKNKSVGELPSLYSKISHLLSLDAATNYENDDDAVVEPSIINGGVASVITIPLSGTSFLPINSNGAYTFTNKDASNNYFAKINGDVTIGDTMSSEPVVFNGFMIATGNITIAANSKIKGIIISTGETGAGDFAIGNGVYVNGRLIAAGNINVGSGCTFESKETPSESIETYIASIFTEEEPILKYIFGNQERTINFTENLPASNLVDLSNLISYENWQKVE